MNEKSRFGFLRRNVGYKVLSLVLSVLLYTVVHASRRPMTNKEVFVQPEMVNLPPDMLVKTPPAGSRVTVSGSASAVEEFRNQRIKAVINLAGAKPGANVVEIKYRGEDAGVEIVGPQRTEVQVEKRESATFTVDVLYNEKAPPGFVFEGPNAQPSNVKVSGLRSEVSRVVRVVAILNNSDNSGAFTGELDLMAQSARYEEIDTVTVEPPRVKVTLGLRKAPLNKEMVLSARLSGSPAPGYALVGYAFEPPAVTVTGAKAEITERSSLSVPVDVSGITSTTVRRIRIPVPPGLAMVQPESGSVSLRLEVAPIALPSATPLPPPTPQPKPTTGPD